MEEMRFFDPALRDRKNASPVKSCVQFTSNLAGKSDFTDNLHSFGGAKIEMLIYQIKRIIPP